MLKLRHAVPRHEDFTEQFNFNNHIMMQQDDQLKNAPQISVQLKDNRVLQSQSYNTPLGLYSKENIANTLVATMQRYT